MHLLSRIQSCCIPYFKKFDSLKLTSRGFKSVKTQIRSSKLQTKNPNEEVVSARKNILKCALFSTGFVGLIYSESAIHQYKKTKISFENGYFNGILNEHWNGKAGGIRKQFNSWWNGLSDGHKVFWPILFLNASVFACWKVARFQPLMMKYFTATPYKRVVCIPLLLSCFSHHSILHLGANMFVFHSFSHPIGAMIGYDDLLAFYMSACVLSSLGASIVKVITKTKGPSLGASGAIMALLSYFCCQNPNAELGIIFVPYFRLSAETALYALVCFDLAGILFKFKLFDHGAHLAGALLGIIYAKYVEQMWTNYKIKVFKDLKAIDKGIK